MSLPPETFRDGPASRTPRDGAPAPTSRDGRDGLAPRTTREGAPLTTRDGPVPLTTRDGPAPPTSREGAGAASRDGVAGGFSRVNLLPPLQSRYTVVGDLSSAGGEADLVLCRRLADNALVVVKLYRQRQSSLDTGTLGRLTGADRSQAHAHVVDTHDYGEFEGYWWEVQEYVASGSLQDLAEREGPALPLPLLTDVLRELTAALEYVHGLGLVHRDVKPSNILVRSRTPLDLVLADFGLAVVLAASREMRSGSRTSAYGAPEAAWGDTSPSRDWWSAGITLLELATGQNPFRLPDGRWLEDAQINRELATRPVDVSGVADARWRLLLSGLLTRDPARRWDGARVREWLAGGTPAVAEEVAAAGDAAGAAGRARPFGFRGQVHTSPVSLAAHMAREWDAAADILGRDLDELADWLGGFPESRGLTRAIQACREKRWRPDREVATLLAEMDPDREATFRGFHVEPGALTDLAARAVGDDTVALNAVRRLRSSRALLAYAPLAGCAELTAVDDVWQRNYAEFERRLGQPGMPAEVVAQAQERGAAWLLLSVTDQAQAARLAARAEEAGTATARTRAWFAALLQPAADPALSPARNWLVVASAPTAEEEHRRQVRMDREQAQAAEAAARERRRQDERRRLEQQARSEINGLSGRRFVRHRWLLAVPITWPGLMAIILGPLVHGFAPQGLISAMYVVVPVALAIVLTIEIAVAIRHRNAQVRISELQAFLRGEREMPPPRSSAG